jgi:hypothetical protein
VGIANAKNEYFYETISFDKKNDRFKRRLHAVFVRIIYNVHNTIYSIFLNSVGTF